jgi:hypothetical protein
VRADDEWLTGHKRAVLADFALAKRRADWRLGRWTAKALVSGVVDVPFDRIEVPAADDGVPEVLVDARPAGWSLSLSHRDAVAVGKEASARVLRQGPRLDVRRAVGDCGPPAVGWSPLVVTWRSRESCTRARGGTTTARSSPLSLILPRIGRWPQSTAVPRRDTGSHEGTKLPAFRAASPVAVSAVVIDDERASDSETGHQRRSRG